MKETLDGKTWTASDGMASEVETQELLAALIRISKPSVVIETGTYLGDATAAMALALASNERGQLWSCDTDTAHLLVANTRIEGARRYTWLRHQTGIDMIASIGEPIDFAFLDSSGDRLEEVQALLPKLCPGAIVVIHDSRRIPESNAIQWLCDHADCEVVNFKTPRGVTVMRISDG